MFQKLLPYDVAHLILIDYLKYYHQFKRITKRAKIRFEHRDWAGHQQDVKDRVFLYRNMVGGTTATIREFLKNEPTDTSFWKDVKSMYFDEIRNFNTRNIAETFFNSVVRHYHIGLGAAAEFMFVNSTGTYREFKSTYPIFHIFNFSISIPYTVRRVLSLFHFEAPFEDLERDVDYMSRALKKKLDKEGVPWKGLRLEILKSIFFRNKAGYFVGKIYINDLPIPFVVALLHQEKGIKVDTLLLEYNDVSSIFSFNRSYFIVDVDIVSETIDFIEPILPSKSKNELYNSIGFEKHGKTVFYREFNRHLLRSHDKFVTAEGIKGMVMAVFTLPSYPMVFKIIKDKFAEPKKVTEAIVKEKYEMVNQHGRVGRMTDSHMFQNMVFDKNRFSLELLEELLVDAPSKLVVTDKTVEIKHMYVEKRMIPLNIYLEKATKEEAKEAIDEYGKAIKQLAAVNIFPGDMLLKNFGVTRLKRVVFYDYDEIGFLTDFNFRRIPKPRDDYEEFSREPFFHVGPDDIFPEEFTRFLIGNADTRALFSELHGDLFDIVFWRNMQERLRNGEIVDVFPYKESLRFGYIFENEESEDTGLLHG